MTRLIDSDRIVHLQEGINMSTFKQALIEYYSLVQELKAAQKNLDKMKADLKAKAEGVRSHPDGIWETSLLVIMEDSEIFTMFVEHPDNWSDNPTKDIAMARLTRLD